MELFNFFNSSAAYRVRIALALKGLPWTPVSVNLRAGEQHQAGYRALNSARLVPTLRDGHRSITQSLAIIDALDRSHPEPLLVPRSDPQRTRVLEIALLIACDIHPLNNMRVQKYLAGPLAIDDTRKAGWVAHWLGTGFEAIEATLDDGSDWCVGDAPTLADCCLVPQVANALRAKFSLEPFARIRRIYEHCMRQPAFRSAVPEAQPDFVDH